MAFNKAPSNFFGPGYAFSVDQIQLDVANGADPLLLELSAAEANATTGDAREVVRACCDAFYSKYAGLAEANRPVRMVIAKGTQVNQDGTLTRSYSFSFTTDIITENITDE